MKTHDKAADVTGAGMTDDLDDLFRQAKAAVPPASAALLARIEADALALQPRSDRRASSGGVAGPVAGPVAGSVAGPVTGSVTGAWRGLWAELLASLGGRPGLAGLAAVMLVGVWAGFVQPAPVAGLAEGFWFEASAVEAVELIPDLAGLMAEG